MHNHIGSQIFDIEPFKSAAKVMLEFMNQIRTETGDCHRRIKSWRWIWYQVCRQ